MHSDTPASHLAFMQALYHDRPSMTRDETTRLFLDQTAQPIFLSRLKRLMEQQRSYEAIEVVRRRWRLIVDEFYRVDTNDRNLHLGVTSHALDFISFIQKEPGLQSLIPTGNAPYNFIFNAYFANNVRTRPWKVKRGMVGFDYTGSMLYIGDLNSVDIFLALAPRALGSPDWVEVFPSAIKDKDESLSIMPLPRYRAIIMFIAHCMAQISSANVIVLDPYPNIRDHHAVIAATDLW